MSAVGGSANATSQLVTLADAIAGALDRGLGVREMGTELALEPKVINSLPRFIEHLPAALEAFIQAPEAPKKPARAPSAVSKPTTELSGQLRPLTLPIIDLRKGTPDPLECVAITPLGLVLTSARPLQESSVIRLSLHAEPPIEAWFTVLLCAPEQQRFRVELQAFAASEELRKRMAELWASAPPALPT